MSKRIAHLYAFKICTSNNPTSGNPRRGYLIYREVSGELVGFADEDYDGESLIFLRIEERMDNELSNYKRRHVCHKVVLLGIVDVPVSEYRQARGHDRQL